jgi:NDP-sugar pyrophosphorylase family protein
MDPFEGFIEKNPACDGAATANAGIYLVPAMFLDQIAAGQAISLERDVLERLPPGSLPPVTARFDFIDIGTTKSLTRARTMFGADARSRPRPSRPAS